MIRLVQYIPAFVETGEPPKEATVENVAAMLALPWVKEWEQDAGFVRWGYSDRHLMAISKGKWWVVAIIIEGDVPATELPEWSGPGDAR